MFPVCGRETAETEKLTYSLELESARNWVGSLSTRNHGLITGWRILGILSIPMKNMVGTRRLELLTSTVSTAS